MHARTSRVLAASVRRDDERIFRSAVRHSRLVRSLRLGIPVLIVSAIAVAAVVSLLKPLRVLANLPVNIGNMVILVPETTTPLTSTGILASTRRGLNQVVSATPVATATRMQAGMTSRSIRTRRL